LLPGVAEVGAVDEGERDEGEDEQHPGVGVTGAPEAAAQGVVVVGSTCGDPVPQQAGAAEHDRGEHDQEDPRGP